MFCNLFETVLKRNVADGRPEALNWNGQFFLPSHCRISSGIVLSVGIDCLLRVCVGGHLKVNYRLSLEGEQKGQAGRKVPEGVAQSAPDWSFCSLGWCHSITRRIHSPLLFHREIAGPKALSGHRICTCNMSIKSQNLLVLQIRCRTKQKCQQYSFFTNVYTDDCTCDVWLSQHTTLWRNFYVFTVINMFRLGQCVSDRRAPLFSLLLANSLFRQHNSR